jgi:hypothetical protein
VGGVGPVPRSTARGLSARQQWPRPTEAGRTDPSPRGCIPVVCDPGSSKPFSGYSASQAHDGLIIKLIFSSTLLTLITCSACAPAPSGAQQRYPCAGEFRERHYGNKDRASR